MDKWVFVGKKNELSVPEALPGVVKYSPDIGVFIILDK